MISTVRLSAKRQATLPQELCDEMHLKPGDEIHFNKCQVNGTVVYCLVPKKSDNRHEWVGSLRAYAKGKSTDMNEIRKCIGKAIGRSRCTE